MDKKQIEAPDLFARARQIVIEGAEADNLPLLRMYGGGRPEGREVVQGASQESAISDAIAAARPRVAHFVDTARNRQIGEFIYLIEVERHDDVLRVCGMMQIFERTPAGIEFREMGVWEPHPSFEAVKWIPAAGAMVEGFLRAKVAEN